MVAVHSPMAIFPVSKVSWAAPLHVPCPQGCLPFIPLGQILCHWGIFCSFVYYYKEGPLLFMFPENGCCSPSLTMFSVLENGHVPRTSGWLPFILLSSMFCSRGGSPGSHLLFPVPQSGRRLYSLAMFPLGLVPSSPVSPITVCPSDAVTAMVSKLHLSWRNH